MCKMNTKLCVIYERKKTEVSTSPRHGHIMHFVYECTLAVAGLMTVFTFLRRARWDKNMIRHYMKTVYVRDCL